MKIAKDSQYYNSRRLLRPAGVTLILLELTKCSFRVSTFTKIEESGLKCVFAPIFDKKESKLRKSLALILVKNMNKKMKQPFLSQELKTNYNAVNIIIIFYQILTNIWKKIRKTTWIKTRQYHLLFTKL